MVVRVLHVLGPGQLLQAANASSAEDQQEQGTAAAVVQEGLELVQQQLSAARTQHEAALAEVTVLKQQVGLVDATVILARLPRSYCIERAAFVSRVSSGT